MKFNKITVDNYKQNPLKIVQNEFLRNLKNYDYIGQISNKLKEIFDKGNNVSKETIYIYVFCKSELKKELREIKASKRQEPQIPDIRSISERPKEDRTIPGKEI